ncbi:MAG TPA: family 20 glycosylhydrolase [Puia sp.]
MKKITLLGTFLFSLLAAFTQNNISIIPQPVTLTVNMGNFILPSHITISADNNPGLKQALADLTSRLSVPTGYSVSMSNSSSATIRLSLNQKANPEIGNEGYQLTVTNKKVTITANQSAGILYGVQSFLQLLPAEITTDSLVKNISWSAPCVSITDYPRFGWRGLMLDVSRHFFTKKEVEQYMDQMAVYKYNMLHLHLSDDQGWRVEIKSLPQLTSTGGWRVKRTGLWGEFLPALAYEQATDGGFYTQDDIREMIAYAKERNITILPEIDVPAHSLAMIAAFQNLSCTQLPYSVNAGFRNALRDDNALCIGNDSVFLMLDKIFTELAAIFPCEYIHVGGDEAYKGFWSDCPKCQKRMADEHLKNVDELQSYFVRRIEVILKSKGKKLIGWDEILEGGLAPEATVMSWRGMKGGIEAAKMNHHVVMTPWDYCYLDLYQGETSVEPTTYGICRLTDSYTYDPVPDSVDEKMILGGQGNLWSERVYNFRQAEYMTWPRGLALAEVYWSPKASRNWDHFIEKMEAQFPRLDAAGIKYARSAYNVIYTPVRNKDGRTYTLKISSEIKGLDIYYTFDGTNPDPWYPKYTGEPINFPFGATQITANTFRNGKMVGKQVTIKKDDLPARYSQGHHQY